MTAVVTLTKTWQRIAAAAEDLALITTDAVARIEWATGTDAAAPTTAGHTLNARDRLTRADIGSGAIWARIDAAESFDTCPIVVSTGTHPTDVAIFRPDATTTVLAVTATSARTALPAGMAVRLSNAGDSAISVRFGDSTVTAATTAMDILPGSAEVFRVPVGATHLAAIIASGTGSLKITAGSGA